MSSVPEDIDLHNLDFDALYETGQIAEGVDVAAVPWDIGGAQPVVIEAERAGRLHGAVLDVGCGLGDNAIYLARQGHQVTGIDSAPTAIEQANSRARQRRRGRLLRGGRRHQPGRFRRPLRQRARRRLLPLPRRGRQACLCRRPPSRHPA